MKNHLEDIHQIRHKLLTNILIFLLVCGSIALGGSLLRAVHAGWRPVMSLHVGAYLVVLAVTIMGRRLSYILRVFVFLSLMLALAVAGLIQWGLMGTGILIMATFIVCITLLLGNRVGVIAVALSLLLIGAVGWAVNAGVVVYSFDAQAYLVSSSSWINVVASCLLWFGVIVGCTGYIIKCLLELSDDYKQRYVDLDVANRQLAESESRYRTLFNTARDGIFIMQEYRFKACNPRVLELFGCSRDDMVDSYPYLWSPEYQPNGRRSEEEAKKRVAEAYNGRNQMFEWRHQRKDGTLFDVEVSLTRMEIRGESHLVAAVRDITDRKRAENALRESEEKQRSIVARQSLILDSLPMAFYSAEASEEYDSIWVSDQVNRIAGFTREQFMGDRGLWQSRLHPADKPTVTAAFDNISEAEELTVEYRWEHADGEYRWIQDHAVLVRDDDGRPWEIVGTWLDITDRKNAALERQKLEQQLMLSQKLEALGTLAGGIAHDFNNILFPMIGNLEMIISALSKDDELYDRVTRVLEGGRRARDLVRQILSISRQTDEEAGPLDIVPIVREVVALSRSTLPSFITIHADIMPDCGDVMAIPAHIHQVIMNLITNAYHAMQETGGRLDIGLRKVCVNEMMCEEMDLQPGDYVLLTVSDTGKGMSRKVLDRVFDPYFTTKGVGEGTGLGLFIVHGLVKKHGGDIAIKSALGKGANFYVYLPVYRGSSDEPVQAPDDSAIPTGTEHVLVVDDEEAILLLMRDFLEEFGYKVSTHVSSQAALEMMQSDSSDVDILITDMTMPEMNGLELAEKTHAIQPDIPIVLITGYSEQITSEKMIEVGVCENLMKPIPLAELGKIIRRLLDSR